ncbi:MAG TPA: hypothetical protein VFF69_04900 [Phycisphaerales bacterium]|nr:hypothetical protein [Phycisphaerales bacterium]
MKLVKLLIALVVLVVILAGAGLLVGFVMVDRLAARGVEAGGSYALGVPTELDSADVGVFSGTVELSGLRVANPEGYAAPQFMTMRNGGVAVSMGSLRGDVVEVPTLTLSDIDVFLERAGGKANYQVIIDNLKRFESGETPPPESESGKRFIIRRVEIKNVAAHVSLLPLGGEMATAEVIVPQVVLTDVGADEPLKLGEVVRVVTQAVLATIAANAGGVLPADLAGELQSQLEKLGGLQALGVDVAADFGAGLQEVVGSLEGAAGRVGELQERAEGLEEELKGAGDRLRGLLGGDEEEQKDPGGG